MVSRLSALTADQLDAGEATIKIASSSVNYKHALAVTDAGKIIRHFPGLGSIDFGLPRRSHFYQTF